MRLLQNTTGATAGSEACDMRKRILSAAILVPLLLIALYALPKVVTVILVSLVCAIAAYELLVGTRMVGHIRLVIYSMVFAALVPVWCYYGMDGLAARVAILLFFALLFVEFMLSSMKMPFEKFAVCIFAAILIPYLLTSLVRIYAPVGGRYVILIPFVIAFLADSGAYFVGCRFGKHKLAPVISPNKSVEGVLGGVAAAVIGMLLYCVVMQLIFGCTVNYGYALLYGLLGTVADVFGDLCFSAIKRQTGIKDYGNLIPGHGGVLDRFDSMLTVGPLVEILLIVLPVVVK